MGKVFNPILKRYTYADFFCDLAQGHPSVVCFVLQVHAKNPTQCFTLKVSIKKPIYCQLLTSFRISNRMFVDVFIECVTWSYWWTWCVLPIICNSEHFSFFVFYFNVSNKIFSTSPRLLSFQFSTPFPSVYYNPLSIRHSRVD